MADDGDEKQSTPEECLLQRHKKEKKELQAQVQKLKHSVPKGDKKKKKEITAQVAILEAELEAKHEQELKEFKERDSAAVKEVAEAVDDLSLNDKAAGGEPIVKEVKEQKMSKAQKRREKKAQQEREREQRIQEQERENEFGVRNIEASKLKALLKARNLAIHEIPSDGNCLYSAVEHQLGRHSITSSIPTLRKQTADQMRSNVALYIPFLCNQDTGDPFSLDEFSEYCTKLETTPEWGGQLEITALSHALKSKIEVIQADGPSITVGEEYNGNTLLLSYHRHAYKLGEHYNSIVPKRSNNESDEEFS